MSGSSWADFPKYVEPGQTIEWRVNGEFWYIKQGQDLKIQVFNQTCTGAQKGDGGNYDKSFEHLVVTNRTAYRQLVNLVIGFGKFDRKDVTGTIYAVNGLLDAEGNTLSDDRINKNGYIALTRTTSENQVAGAKDNDLQGVINTPLGITRKGDKIYFLHQENINPYTLRVNEYNRKGDYLSSFTIDASAAPFGQPVSQKSAIYREGYVYWLNVGLNTFYKLDAVTGELSTFNINLNASQPSALNQLVFNDATLKFYLAIAAGGTTSDGLELFEFDETGVSKTLAFDKPSYIGESENLRVSTLNVLSGDLVVTYNDSSGYFEAASFIDLTKDEISEYTPGYTQPRYPKAGFIDAIYNRAWYGTTNSGECGFLETKTISAAGNFASQNLIKITEKADSLPIESGLSISSDGMTLSGPIIKTVLELIGKERGKALPADYLDYVYGLGFDGNDEVRTGDESFLRVGVTDNFSISPLTRISIYYSGRIFA